MQFKDLAVDQKITIQIKWGDKTIGFDSVVLLKDDNGVYVSPYLHQDKPLEINVDMNSGIGCDVQAIDPSTGERVVWKGIDVKSREKTLGFSYYLTTSVFKTTAISDERRQSTRMVIRKPGQLFDPGNNGSTDILIHDISDTGISFYAPINRMPTSGKLVIKFQDSLDGRVFDIMLNCSIARSVQKPGTMFYGCRINGDNRDFMIYGFMKRLKIKNEMSQNNKEDKENK